MALSGSKTVTVTSWDSLIFSWSASQSVSNNTSTVAWTLKLKATSSGKISSTASKSWSVTVNGTKYSGTNTVGIANNTTKTLASGSTVIKHNSDGTKSFDYSFSQQFSITFSGSSIGTVSGSGSGTLDTIPRASSLTAGNGTLGTAQILTINRADSTFKHRITYECGSASGYVAGSSSAFTTDTSISWTPALSLATQNKTGASVSVKLTLKTYNSGGTQIGTATKTISCAIPASVKPSCSLSVTDSTGYADTYGNPVKGLSKFKVVVTPTLAQESPIASYSVTANGSKYTAASFTTGVLKSSGTLTVSATVTDKRGRTGSASVSKTVLNYAKPTISKLAVKRCNSDGTSNAQGEYVQVTFSATVTSLNNKNTATYTLKYKKSTATSYTSVNISALQNVYSATDKTYIFAADTGSSYNVELAVKDNHGTATKSTSASTGFTLMHWLADGTGMAIGKIAELSKVFDIGLVTRIREHLNVGNKTGHLDGNTGVFIAKDGYIQVQRDTSQGYHPYIAFFLDNATTADGLVRLNCSTKQMEFLEAAGYKFGSDIFLENNEAIMGYDTSGNPVNAFQAQNSSNNTIVGYGNYDRKSGNTNIYGHDLNFGISNIPTPGAYRPYRRQGDTISIVIRTAGYVTNGGKDVSFWIPCSEPIIGSPTATAKSNDGFVLRQGAKYTHGSGAEVYINPTSYEATATMYSGIYIKAVFNDTTNVTNNDAIGIYWSGTITLS